MNDWSAYSPSDSAPWNLDRVIHLGRRAVFGATWAEIQRDLHDQPQNAVSRIIDGTSRIETPANFAELAGVIGDAAADSPNPDRLKAWWLYRCLFSQDPLEERLTLMWHNHFATSNLKVDNLHQIKQQNDSLRRYARSSFGELLRAMVRDPALLVWLDAPANRKGHPNENLARELMELFTVGIGNYAEQDVKEAARALTGWTIDNGRFHVDQESHESEVKTILRQSGNWNGDDVVNLLLQQPGTANRLAWRLTNEFFGENVVNDEALSQLAEVLRGNNLDIGATVELMLRSQLFFSDDNIQSRVCDPVSFLVGPIRALECFREPPSTLILAEWLRRMGQDLFYPPNVGGWNGGRTWLSTRTIIARTNYGAALTSGELHNPVQAPDLTRLLKSHGKNASLMDHIQFLAQVLGVTFDDRALAHVAERAERTPPQEQAAAIVVSLLSRPEAHLH